MSSKNGTLDWSVFSPGAPGRSARIIGYNKIRPVLIVGFSLCALCFYAALKILSYGPNPLSMAIIISAGVVWLFRKPIERKIDPIGETWLKGARGEWTVGSLLEKELDPREFKVIHDLNDGHGNIDHVVIGTTGIFAIETKSVHGKIDYENGKLTNNGYLFGRDPIKEVHYEAAVIAEKLGRITGNRPYVNAIICSVDAWVERRAMYVEHVDICRPQYLLKLITRGNKKYTPELVERMANSLRITMPPIKT